MVEHDFFGAGIATFVGSIAQLRRENVEKEKIVQLQDLVQNALIEWSKVEPEQAKEVGAGLAMFIGTPRLAGMVGQPAMAGAGNDGQAMEKNSRRPRFQRCPGKTYRRCS